ncbi:MAG: hypothetical protein PHH00_01465 [Candidatus Nanoarchaeia archaeon]|nr:hypothetical protein [Candidatus Nanoarchaeia archaeon]
MIIRRKNKRGVSEIIGYILLIAIVVVVSIFVFQWLKSYVPQSALTCPDGTAVSVPEYDYDCTNNILNFTLQNQGTFTIDGYFIHASNESEEGIANRDLTPYYMGDKNNRTFGGILFEIYSIEPGQSESANDNTFNLNLKFPAIKNGTLKKMEIIPIKYVEYKGKQRIASCGDAKISIPVECN